MVIYSHRPCIECGAKEKLPEIVRYVTELWTVYSVFTVQADREIDAGYIGYRTQRRSFLFLQTIGEDLHREQISKAEADTGEGQQNVNLQSFPPTVMKRRVDGD